MISHDHCVTWPWKLTLRSSPSTVCPLVCLSALPPFFLSCLLAGHFLSSDVCFVIRMHFFQNQPPFVNFIRPFSVEHRGTLILRVRPLSFKLKTWRCYASSSPCMWTVSSFWLNGLNLTFEICLWFCVGYQFDLAVSLCCRHKPEARHDTRRLISELSAEHSLHWKSTYWVLKLVKDIFVIFTDVFCQ